MERSANITDAQWLALMGACPPDARLVAVTAEYVAARREDGTGVLVEPDGTVLQVDAEGNLVD